MFSRHVRYLGYWLLGDFTVVAKEAFSLQGAPQWEPVSKSTHQYIPFHIYSCRATT